MCLPTVTLDWTLLTSKCQLPECFGGQALHRTGNNFLFRVKNIPLVSAVTHTHGLWVVPAGTLSTEKGDNWCLPPRVLSAVCFHGRRGRGGPEEARRGGGRDAKRNPKV